MAAQKHTTSPEAKNANKRPSKPPISALTAVPSTSKATSISTPDLTGVPEAPTVETLPDLVQNCKTLQSELPLVAVVDPVSTEEELDAINALLSLSKVRDNTLDDDDNADLMPIGAPTNIVDAAPVPIRLDQINVDTAIAELVQTEEIEKQTTEEVIPNPEEDANKPDNTGKDAVGGPVSDKPTSAPSGVKTEKCVTHTRLSKNQNTCSEEKAGEQSKVQMFSLWGLQKVNASCERTSLEEAQATDLPYLWPQLCFGFLTYKTLL